MLEEAVLTRLSWIYNWAFANRITDCDIPIRCTNIIADFELLKSDRKAIFEHLSCAMYLVTLCKGIPNIMVTFERRITKAKSEAFAKEYFKISLDSSFFRASSYDILVVYLVNISPN